MKSISSPFDAVSPLDFRYYGADPAFFERLEPYVSEKGRIRYAARVEAALARALAEIGVCSTAAARKIEQACNDVTPEEVWEEEQKTQHDLRALVNCIRSRLGDDREAKRVVHLFATSADIQDTANSLRIKELCKNQIVPDLKALLRDLIRIAKTHAETRQIGRTHGKHAVPITFGFAIALYVERLGTRIVGIDQAAKKLRGKMSGAVGAYNALVLGGEGDPVQFERNFLASLGLDCPLSHISSQIVIPEPVQDLTHAVISTFTVLANLADDIRQLHRSEIEEVQEEYTGARVGSSTMPHKTNPKNFENIKSLWKAFMPRMVTVYLDGISEHQRDLTNSASGRFLLESFVALDCATVRMKDSLGRMRVDRDAMRRNLERAAVSVVAEPLYILLALHDRDADAYDRVRELVRASERNGRSLAAEVGESAELREVLERIPDDKRAMLDDPTGYTGFAAQRTQQICAHWELEIQTLDRLG